MSSSLFLWIWGPKVKVLQSESATFQGGQKMSHLTLFYQKTHYAEILQDSYTPLDYYLAYHLIEQKAC